MKTVEMPNLFVMDHGRLRVRKSKVSGTKENALWLVETGLVEGVLVPHPVEYTKGKGKRTPFEQACSEQLSKHKLKIKKDKYREGEENAIDPADDLYPQPMLAKKYDSAKHVVPYFMQPKLDGNRCLARVKNGMVDMWSRQGNLFTGLEHIEEALVELAESAGGDEIIFDGELFTWELPFKDINGALKRKDVDPETVTGKAYDKAINSREQKAKIQYWIYDLPNQSGTEMVRQAVLETTCKTADIPVGTPNLTVADSPLVLVETLYIMKEELADQLHARYREEGYEGSILRMVAGEYNFDKRSPHLLKRKDFQDSEFLVIDVVEAEKLAGAGVFVCQTEGGTTFKATPKCSHAEKRTILENKEDYIGKEITVEYFETFEDGTPRFPVAKLPF